jgi:hypothetical protein
MSSSDSDIEVLEEKTEIAWDLKTDFVPLAEYLIREIFVPKSKKHQKCVQRRQRRPFPALCSRSCIAANNGYKRRRGGSGRG